MRRIVLFGAVLLLAVGGRAQGNDDSYTFEYETLPSGVVQISHNLKPSLKERGDRAQGTVMGMVSDSPGEQTPRAFVFLRKNDNLFDCERDKMKNHLYLCRQIR